MFYALIESRFTLSYASLFIAGKLCIVAKSLDQPFIVYTLIGEFIVVRRVYRGYTIEIIDLNTSVYLVELELVDFDMRWVWTC